VKLVLDVPAVPPEGRGGFNAPTQRVAAILEELAPNERLATAMMSLTFVA